MVHHSKPGLRPLAKVHPVFVQASNRAGDKARLRLTPGVLTWIWKRAEILSEGEVFREAGEIPRYLGSTMIAIDLSPLVGKASPEKKGQLMMLLRSSLKLRLRCIRLALQEARRRCSWECLNAQGGLGGPAQTEFRCRQDSSGRFFIDVDIEIPLLMTDSCIASV